MSLLSPQLQAFVLIAEKKSVHQAAEKLNLSQTAITQRLRQLEQRLDTSLFVRSRRGMLLTPEGETLLRYCRGCLDLEDETLSKLRGQQTVSLRISGPTSLMSARIIPACINVMTQHPNLMMHFDISDRFDTLQNLREGVSQFAILIPEQVQPEMETKQLSPEEYILVSSYAWRKRKLKEILSTERIIDFDPDDQMTYQYLKHFDLFAYAQHQRHFVNRTESIANLVIAGLGFSVLAKEFCQPYINNQQMICLNNNKSFHYEYRLAWYPRPQFPTYIETIIKNIK